MRIKVDRNSPAYHRVISAGFRIRNINLFRDGDYYIPLIVFTCVCGTMERFVGIVYHRSEIPKRLDVACMMEKADALSVEHLKEDGYSGEEIKDIRRAYERTNNL